MGISTFIHLISPEAKGVLALCADKTVSRFISALCKRPWVQSEQQGDVQQEEVIVDDMETLRELLEAPASNKAGGYGDDVYMEVGTKFWQAKIVGNMFVSVTYGKKGTKGQSNSYSGADARAYFDKKVKEKLKKKYKIKDPDAAANKKALAALPEAPAEPDSKRKKTVLYRTDLDKAGALVSYLVSQLTSISLGDEHELLMAVLKTEPVGTDISYGPAYYATPEQVSSLHQALAAFTRDDAAALFDGEMPSLLGGICDISKEKDMEYGLIHFSNFKQLLAQAAENQMGFLIHFW